LQAIISGSLRAALKMTSAACKIVSSRTRSMKSHHAAVSRRQPHCILEAEGAHDLAGCASPISIATCALRRINPAPATGGLTGGPFLGPSGRALLR
jgi:hypothetical protein